MPLRVPLKAITWPAANALCQADPRLLSTASVFFALREIDVGADHTPRNAVAIIVNAATRLDPSRLGVAAKDAILGVVLAASLGYGMLQMHVESGKSSGVYASPPFGA